MSETTNILITSAGRRVSLVKIFQQTLAELGLQGEVCAVDAAPRLSAACQLADRYQAAPPVSSPEYIPFLLRLCRDRNISIVVPTIDPELLPLATAKPTFAAQGVAVAVSSPELCATMSRTTTAHEFFQRRGFETPRIHELIPNDAFPVFAKPDVSSGSIGSEKVNSASRAAELRAINSDYVFQQFLKGEEFTMDVFVDFHGQVIDVVPRQRLEVRAGEVAKGVTVRDEELIAQCLRLCDQMPGPYGVLNVQVFKTTEGIFFTEVNPRFGGGFPLSYHAGANMAAYLVRDALGQPLEYKNRWKDGILMLRYDGEVILDYGE